MNYWELIFSVSPKMPWSDIIIAELSEIGFESFVETDTGLKAYIQEDAWEEEGFKNFQLLFNSWEEARISYDKILIEAQNWNASWESSFEPVLVGNELAIIAPFHEEVKDVNYTVIIEPKMSFGTGHHQTTRLMSKALLELESMPESVLDMGCGTGVLAILAEKLGAKKVLAVDVELWAFENTIENVGRNECSKIEVLHGDSNRLQGRNFDLILANINKNVLLQDLAIYSKCLNNNGLLMLSGFFTSDNEMIVDSAKNANLALLKTSSEENWSCLVFVKI